MSSLRAAIDEKCRSCVVDPLAAGTWRQQTTLCSVTSCPLWPHRPTTKAVIPASVFRYYAIKLSNSEHVDGDCTQTTADPSSVRDGSDSPHPELTDPNLAGEEM